MFLRRDVDVKQLVADTTHNQALVDATSLVTMDVAELDDYKKLKSAVEAYGADQTLVYLSVPPGAAAQIVDLMGEAGLNTPDIHLLFEKPFGFDLESAKDFIGRTSRYFKEAQLYRIDHYMAKEVAAELAPTAEYRQCSSPLGCRTGRKCDYCCVGKIGIEGRAQFYEQTGALRDFVQGHLLQLLSLVLMTRPSVDKDLAAQRLASLEYVAPVDVARASRGQYEGYQEEAQNPGSAVETFVAVELKSTDPNWLGVPLRLVTGKALDEKRSYITIEYKDGSSDIFEEGKVSVPEGQRRLDAYERVISGGYCGP